MNLECKFIKILLDLNKIFKIRKHEINFRFSYDLKISMILYVLRMFINSSSCSFSWNVALLYKTINLMLLIIRSFDRAINPEAWKTSHLSTFYYEVIKQQIKHRMRTWIRIGFIIWEFCVALEMQSDKDAIKIKFPSSPSFGAALMQTI